MSGGAKGGAIVPAAAPAPSLADTVRGVVVPHPFRPERRMVELPEGATLAEMLTEAGVVPSAATGLRVWIDGHEIPPALWHRVRPRAGRMVFARAVPMGGGGGGKNPLRVLLQIAVIAAAAIIPGPAVLALEGAMATLASGAIAFGGNMLVNALVPPPAPRLSAGNEDRASYAVTGTQNSADPYGPVPQLFGRHRVWPRRAATFWTEVRGDDLDLRAVFSFGYGPIRLSDHRIGETPLSDYDDVEMEVREGRAGDAPLTIYPGQVAEQQIGIEVKRDDQWVGRTVPGGVNRISLDIWMPGGLIRVDRSGDKFSRTLTVRIRYRAEGGTAWIERPNLVVTEKTYKQLRRTAGWSVPLGPAYEVQIRKVEEEEDPSVGIRMFIWSALRGFRPGNPVLHQGQALVALRIRASNQLSGTLEGYNATAELLTPDWDAATSTWVERATRSPAAAFRRALLGPATDGPPPTAEVDLDGLADWSEWCRAQGFEFDAWADMRAPLRQILSDIAAAGWATLSRPGGKIGVSIDRPAEAPQQVLGPRNSWGFELERRWRRPVHGYKVRFYNEDAGWAQDERIVFDDGFSTANATNFEALELWGVTHKDQVHRLGRRHIAQRRLRPDIIRLRAGLDALHVVRGDRVDIVHDVIEVGVAAGRIVAIDIDDDPDDPPQAVAIVLDEDCPMAPGRSYVVAIRTGAQLSIARAVVNVATSEPVETRVLQLADPIPAATIAIGDLVHFGEAGRERLACRVLSLERRSDWEVMLELAEEAPAIADAAAGPIPPWTSNRTEAVEIARRKPGAPAIAAVRSDETVLLRQSDGLLLVRILVDLEPRPDVVSGYQIRLRPSGSDSWLALPAAQGVATQLSITDVEEREVYDIELRAISEAGVPSDWARISGHRVVGMSTPPPPVPAAWRVATEDGLRIDWSYPSPPLDWRGFMVRSFAGVEGRWSTAVPVHVGVVTAPPLDMTHIGHGVRTILIRAVDIAGNLSTSSARITVDLGPAEIHNVVEIDDRHPAWEGWLPRGMVQDDRLAGVDDVPYWRAQPDRPFWTGNPAAPHWGTAGYSDIDYLWLYTPSEAARLLVETEMSAPQGFSLEWCEWDGWAWWTGDLDAPFWTGDLDDPAWTGEVEGDWRPWPDAAVVEERTYIFRLHVAGGTLRPTVTTLRMTLDVEDVVELLDDVEIDAGGTRLPLLRDYRYVAHVLVTVQHDGLGAVRAEVTDKSVDGPLIHLFDAAGDPVAGTIDAQIRGARA